MRRTVSRPVVLAALGALLACSVAVSLADWAFLDCYSPSTARQAWPHLHTLAGWARFDSGWYAHIATHGYSYSPGEQSSVAFFPGFPLMLRGLLALGLQVHLAGVLLASACGLGAIALFTHWARLRTEPLTARDAGLLLALYPFAFYLYGAMYSDALFLLLVVGAFFLLEGGMVGGALALGALATATRPVAPALVLGLLVRRLEWKRERSLPWTASDLLPLLAALGLLLYALYLWRAFGNPLAFAQVQSATGWDQAPGWRTWLKLRWLQGFSADMPAADALRLLGHAAFTAAALALVVPTLRRQGWGYGLYAAVAVGLPAFSSKDFMGMGRYVLAAFPLFLTLALLLRERPRLRAGLLAGSALLLLCLATAYGAGAYVS